MARSAIARWRFGEDPAVVAAAVARGALVAIPTESSYGLAVDPRHRAAVESVFRIKGRAGDKAMPVVGASIEQFVALGAAADDPGLAWATPRWPAALSVIVALRRPLPAAAADGTLAVRIPGHEDLRRLLALLGQSLTATSANPSGEAPYLDPRPVADWLAEAGADAVVVDGGVLPGGPPSTLVAWRDGAPAVLRPGRVAIA